MRFLHSFLPLVLSFAFVNASGCASKKVYVTPADVASDMSDQGAIGWIHGAVNEQGLYVFTYRNPKNFLDYLEIPLTAKDPEVLKKIAEFSRHDKVKIKGDFLKLPITQKHIEVTSIELVKKYESPYPSEPFHHEIKLPDDLLAKNSGMFLVHAIAEDGHTLVVEYHDTVLPIFVQDTKLTKNLYRGDIVTMNFEIQKRPHEPVHLKLKEDAPGAIKIIDPILALHGKPADVEGRLILFPKSPEIILNIFAVEAQMPEKLQRQYTLANLENEAVFKEILKKLQDAWDRHPNTYVNARNKLVSKVIRVRVKGTYNEVSASQANAQIIIQSANDIQLIESVIEAKK